jgi:hypothetical protein
LDGVLDDALAFSSAQQLANRSAHPLDDALVGELVSLLVRMSDYLSVHRSDDGLDDELASWLVHSLANSLAHQLDGGWVDALASQS